MFFEVGLGGDTCLTAYDIDESWLTLSYDGLMIQKALMSTIFDWKGLRLGNFHNYQIHITGEHRLGLTFIRLLRKVIVTLLPMRGEQLIS